MGERNFVRFFVGGAVDGSNLTKLYVRRINSIWPELFTDVLLTETRTKDLISTSDLRVISFPQVSTVLHQ